MAKSLTRGQRAHLQEWIDDTKSGLGLTDWEVDLDRKPCVDTAHAHVAFNFEARYAIIHVDPGFTGLTDERQVEILVHELLHLWMSPLIRQVNLFESTVAAQAWQIWEDNWSNSIELIVDGISRAIACNFNPIGWDECGGPCCVPSPKSSAGSDTGVEGVCRP